MQKILKLSLVLFLFAYNIYAQALIQPVNLDFEDGAPGSLPIGWKIPSYAAKLGYTAELVNDEKYEGNQSFLLHAEGFADTLYGSVMQSIDAFPYRGKRIILRAAVKAEVTGDNGSAHLWISERFANNQQGMINRMEDNPIVLNMWDHYQIETEISEYATVLNFGAMFWGSGRVWIDDISIEVVVEDKSAFVKPAPLSDQGLKNLAAFVKILGPLTYFHPSAEIKQINIMRFTLLGMEYIEKAENNSDLVERLKNVILPIAPSVNIYKTDFNIKPQPYFSKPASAIDNVALAQIHQVAGLNKENSGTGSHVVNIYESQRRPEAAVMQHIDPSGMPGKEVKISYYYKSELIKPYSRGEVWIRFDDANDDMISSLKSNPTRALQKTWVKDSVSFIVPENCANIRLGLVMIGDGEVCYDKLQFEMNGEVLESKIGNNDFEDSRPGNLPSRWIFSDKHRKTGYNIEVRSRGCMSRQSLKIFSTVEDRLALPGPGRNYNFKLAEDVYASVPMSVFVDSMSTLPRPDGILNALDINEPRENNLHPEDRTSRFAILSYFWNLISNFTISDVNKDLMNEVLYSALKKAATDRDGEDFIETLEMISSVANDNQCRVWNINENFRYGLPLIWKLRNSELIITDVARNNNQIAPGDVVIKINGTDTQDMLEKLYGRIAGSSDQWKNLRALAMLKAGIQGDSLELTIRSEDGNIKDIVLKKNTLLNELREIRPASFSEIDKDIIYLDITSINDQFLYDNMKMLENAKYIIFDLRGNINVSEHFLGLFLDNTKKSIKWKIPVFTHPDRGSVSYKIFQSWLDPAEIRLTAMPLFLIDERTSGYSDAIAKLIKYYDMGTLVGNNSSGSGGDMVPLWLPGNYRCSLTGISGELPDRENIFDDICIPDVKENYSDEANYFGDPGLFRAIMFIKSLKESKK